MCLTVEGYVFSILFYCVPSGSSGELFAQAPVKEYPGIAVETVSDSSRYFVLRIQDDSGEDVNVTPARVHTTFLLNPPWLCEFEVFCAGCCSTYLFSNVQAAALS